MKKYITSFAIGTLALTLVLSPLASFAKENGKNKSDNENKSNKVEKVEKTNKVMKVQSTNSVRSESEDSDNDNNSSSDSERPSFNKCFRAYGHLIAPGWVKKNGAPDVDTTNCWLPFGIGKKFRGGNASTTPDVTAPVISSVVFNPAKTQAEVRWNTNERSNSIVFWNTTATVDTSDTATNRITKNDFVKSHKVILRNLTANTTYYVVVKSKDAAGNASLSSVGSFTTLPPSTDTQVPVISNVVTILGTSTIQVGWKTNENTTDRVYYSTLLPVVLNASTTSYVSNTTGAQNHTLTISGLSPNTTYYLVIESTDTAGNVTTSATFSAHTGSVVIPADVTPPVISAIVATPGASTTTVTWTTDELATSKVFYSTSNPLDVNATTTSFITNAALTLNHSVSVLGLATSTTYYFKIQSVDASGNTSTSGQVSTTTGM